MTGAQPGDRFPALFPSRPCLPEDRNAVLRGDGSDGTRTRDLRRDRSDQEEGESCQISLFKAE
jgi:hypothetical protein